MTTYTIKPIEWREEALPAYTAAYMSHCNFGAVFLSKERNKYYAVLWDYNSATKNSGYLESLDEAKSFIETSYKEFVEQFLEKI